MEQQNYYNKFIISGGPGFGKTTLLKKLEERQYSVFYEAAIAVIQEQKKSNKPIFPWDNRIAFDHELIKKMRVDYQQGKSNFYNFYDRGFPDLIGWREYDNLDSADVRELVISHPYEKLVFFTKPWKAIYKSTEDRPYLFEEASIINQVLARSYCRLGYMIEYLPQANVEIRANFVLEKISQYR